MNDLILDPKTSLVLSAHDRLSHTFIAGSPDCGVASFVGGLAARDISVHAPVIIIDSNGGMKEAIERNISENDKSRITYMEGIQYLSDLSLSIFRNTGMNHGRIVQSITDYISIIFDPKKAGFFGPRFQFAISNAVSLLLTDPEPSMYKLCTLFTDKNYLEKLIPNVKDESVRAYWMRQSEQSDNVFKSEMWEYLASKFSSLLSRNIFSESTSGSEEINLVTAIQSGRTTLFDLSTLAHDEELYAMTSALILCVIEGAATAKNRQEMFSLYIDEMQTHDASRIRKFALFAKRFGVSLTYMTSRANELNYMQEYGYRQPNFAYECAKFGTKISFRQTGQDKETVEKMFIKTLDREEIPNLSQLKKDVICIQTFKDGEIQIPVVIDW